MNLESFLLEMGKWFGGALIGAVATRIKDRNSELAKRIEQVTEKIHDYVEISVKYWISSGSSAEAAFHETKMTIQSTSIGRELRFLNSEYRQFKFHNWAAVTILRQSATSGSFQSATRVAEPERCRRIEQSAGNLIHAIRQA